MTWSLLLGLCSGVCWGAADFVGGLQARRIPALAVALWSQLIAGSVLLIGLLLRGSLTTSGAGWGVAAGLCGGMALVLLYRALAVGTMSVAAPVSACGALIPVLAGLIQGEQLGLMTMFGIGIALSGVVLVSIQGNSSQATQGVRQSLVLALGSALGFGLFFILIERATNVAGASPLWVNVWARAGSIPLLGVLQLLTTRASGWPGWRLGGIGLAGILDIGANVLFVLAVQVGALGIVSVLGSLYPVTTVLLSWLLLAERLTRLQYIGVGMALVGISLLAGGG